MSDERASLNPAPIATNLPGGGNASAPAAAPVGAEPNLVGQALDGGRYQVMSKLGEGTLCIVYEGRHASSGRHFALKVLRAEYAAKQPSRDRFLQHSSAISQVRHDNIVAIEECGYTPTNSVYASNELIVGDTLQKILERDGRWTWSQARGVLLQIVGGLKFAHQSNILHRALKPSNCFVIIDPRGRRDPLAKISDFGLAQVGVEATQAAPGATTAALFGDPEYMAPEQGLDGKVDVRTDIYAFGILAYRVLGGKVPFSSPNAFQTISQHAQKPVPPLRELDPRIPEAVEQVVARCLAKAPEQRFASAAELEQALAAVPSHAQGGAQAAAPQAPTDAQSQGSGPRFARFSGGDQAGPGSSVPSKGPSVVVAGAIGDSSGGISGTLKGASGGVGPPTVYPGGPGAPSAQQLASLRGASGGVGPPTVYPGGPGAPSAHELSQLRGASGGMGPATVYPGAMSSSPSQPGSSSFLASRPGLRMGLGAGVPGPGGDDGPAPPATIAPGMAMAAPTVAPGMGFPPLSGGPGGLPPLSSGPGMPPAGAGGAPGGLPPLSSGPGMPPPGGGLPPLGGGGGGLPPLGGGGGGGLPPLSAGPGMPSADAGYPPTGGGGLPPLSAGPGMPSRDSGYPPTGGGGLPPLGGGGGGLPPLGGGGGGLPPLGGGGGGLPPLSSGPGMPPPNDAGSPDGIARGVGAGMPARGMMGSPAPGVGPGMPLRRGLGPGMPPPNDPSSGSYRPVSSTPSVPHVEPPADYSVEYDDEPGPKRRPLLVIGIAVAVILGGAGLGWLMVGGGDEPDDEYAKVTRTQKSQDIEPLQDDPEPEPEPEPEPDPEPDPEPQPTKKVAKKQTYPQAVAALKKRILARCSKLGPGPVDIDSFVVKDGGHALAPKVKPKGPVGACALRQVEATVFPSSEQDHDLKMHVTW